MRYKKWPQHLHELVGRGFSPAVPLDPVTGQPLRSRHTQDGMVIYSVGWDRSDDGGQFGLELIEALRSLKRPGMDMGVRLWDPQHRRKTPVPDPRY